MERSHLIAIAVVVAIIVIACGSGGRAGFRERLVPGEAASHLFAVGPTGGPLPAAGETITYDNTVSSSGGKIAYSGGVFTLQPGSYKLTAGFDVFRGTQHAVKAGWTNAAGDLIGVGAIGVDNVYGNQSSQGRAVGIIKAAAPTDVKVTVLSTTGGITSDNRWALIEEVLY